MILIFFTKILSIQNFVFNNLSVKINEIKLDVSVSIQAPILRQ